MRTILTIIMAAMSCISARAYKYAYSFDNIPISEAIIRISKDNPDVNISFIYKELDNYKTTARIQTDDIYDALRQAVALNPVSVIRKGDNYYIEALQHGKFRYTGMALGGDNEPVAGATVMLLAPGDSSVVTYGVADAEGRFNIPCDRTEVIAKLSSIGYQTVYRHCDNFNIGIVTMPVRATVLKSVAVEAQMAAVYSDKTVFIPTARQKNASQTGAELIDHIGIPQLKVFLNGRVETNSGRPVAIYIDFIPASENDLKAMRMADVRRVEYYEYPSDPRMQGNPYAVNFVMAQYEYGGYVKGFNHTNLIHYSEQLLGNVRLQYKKMTYDIMGYGWGHNSDRYGSELTETYRLPQPDGEIKTFERYSNTTKSKERRRQYFTAFKATYNSDNIQASTQINGSIDRIPHADRSGEVRYEPAFTAPSEYRSTMWNASKFISYSGNYFFILPRNNSLLFTPTYVYTHTEQNSSYTENGFAPIQSGATDNTNQLMGDLKFKHDFGKKGNVLGFVRGSYEYNRTRYTGTASSFDRAKSSRVGIGVNYTVNIGDFYGSTGFGWDWDWLRFGDMTDKPSSPWFDLSLQYSLNKKHSFSTVFHYSTWAPDPSFKSENIISTNHLLSYTGNPALKPNKSYDIGAFYSWFPNNNVSFSAFATTWITEDRYVYDYEASPTGILRTIKQPLGGYSQTHYGVNGTLRFLDRKLVFTGEVSHRLSHDGAPYNINHSCVDWYARLRYYLGNCDFTFTYISGSTLSDGKINGILTKSKSDWYVTVGWSKSDWNVKCNIVDITRWNWRSQIKTMHSKYYDTREQLYSGTSHALIQLSATYTFGFGRKVARDNEPSVTKSSSSGILK